MQQPSSRRQPKKCRAQSSGRTAVAPQPARWLHWPTPKNERRSEARTSQATPCSSWAVGDHGVFHEHHDHILSDRRSCTLIADVRRIKTRVCTNISLSPSSLVGTCCVAHTQHLGRVFVFTERVCRDTFALHNLRRLLSLYRSLCRSCE